MEFSMTRFGQLIKREFLIHARIFSLLSILIFLVGVLIMFMSTEEYCNSANDINIIDILVIAMIFVSGTILSASIFTEFRDPASRSLYLSLPASHFEKWLSKWIICVPIHLFVSTGIFVITYMLMGSILNKLWPECRFIQLSLIHIPIFSFLIKQYFIFQSLCFLLGIIYNKYALIKTLATSAIIIFLFSTIITLFIKVLFGENPNQELNINNVIFQNIAYILTPMLWIASYYKLKEKEL